MHCPVNVKNFFKNFFKSIPNCKKFFNHPSVCFLNMAKKKAPQGTFRVIFDLLCAYGF